jgi:phenylacetate-CoA ligase
MKMRPGPDLEHTSRAVEAIARAHREIPFYTRQNRPIPQLGQGPQVLLAGPQAGGPTTQAGDSLDETLRALPLLFKQGVRPTLPKHWVPAGRDAKAELASGDIELVETSGSTTERLRILWEKGWWPRQEERAMRVNGLVDRAMDGAYKEAILTTPVCGLGSCHAGDPTFEERTEANLLFLNSRQDPTFWTPEVMDRMLDELGRQGTVGLEADPAYLAFLARHAAERGRALDVSAFVTLTYALTTRAHVRAVRRAYKGPIFQLYGASEVGVLFMEDEDGRLHHAPFTTHIELLPAKVPTPGSKNVALVVTTTVDRVVMPLVRYVLGDVVQVDVDGVGRLTPVKPLVSIEGRVQDAVVRPDGAIVTAGAMDRALEPLPLAFFQINQDEPSKVRVDVVPEVGAGRNLEEDVRERLGALMHGLAVTVRMQTALGAEPSGKFRVSRRHFPLDLTKSFEGCESARVTL